MSNDYVDQILAQWQRERPDLDTSPMAVVGRVSRLAQHWDAQLERVFQGFGLQRGEFDVLATLRRSGPPFALTPTALFRALMLSSGAMTNRLDRLERAGLIVRKPDPTDRRGTLVHLTEAGRAVVDQAVEAHMHNERQMLAALTPEQQGHLADVLRVLLARLEQGGE